MSICGRGAEDQRRGLRIGEEWFQVCLCVRRGDENGRREGL